MGKGWNVWYSSRIWRGGPDRRYLISETSAWDGGRDNALGFLFLGDDGRRSGRHGMTQLWSHQQHPHCAAPCHSPDTPPSASGTFGIDRFVPFLLPHLEPLLSAPPSRSRLTTQPSAVSSTRRPHSRLAASNKCWLARSACLTGYFCTCAGAGAADGDRACGDLLQVPLLGPACSAQEARDTLTRSPT